jgi:hypothetical protein
MVWTADHRGPPHQAAQPARTTPATLAYAGQAISFICRSGTASTGASVSQARTTTRARRAGDERSIGSLPHKRVSRVLTDLRRQHLLPWHAFEDHTRRTVEKRGIADLREFVREQTETLFDWRYYHRCYVQNQDNYIEVATEKEALTRIMEDAVWEYCVRLNPVRGQVGAPMVKAMAERFTKARANGQRPILLYLGDLDPSGLAIPLSLVRTMAEQQGTRELSGGRAAGYCAGTRPGGPTKAAAHAPRLSLTPGRGRSVGGRQAMGASVPLGARA